MHLALAIHRWFPFGGLQRDLAATAAAARAVGHRVTVVCGRWDGPRPEGLEVCPLAPRGATNHGRARAFGAALGRWRAAARPDRVVGFDKLPGLDAYFAGDPCRLTRVRARRPHLWPLVPRDRAFVALERAVFAPDARTRVLTLTRARADEYRAAWGTPGERFTLLPPGLPADRRRSPRPGARERLRAELGVGDAPLLLAVGSDFRRKGFDRAVAVLARLEGARLAVVGDDDPRPLGRRARALGIEARVDLLGPREDVPELMAAADVLVHPARSEPAGMVLLEALAAGLPAVASAACGYAEHLSAAGAGVVLGDPADADREADRVEPGDGPGRAARGRDRSALQWPARARHGGRARAAETEALARAIATVLDRPRAHWAERAARWCARHDLGALHATLVAEVTGSP